jgi:hypothetical protein
MFKRDTNRNLCCFLNAGVSACGIEIAKALRKLNDKNIVIRVFSWKGPESITYEHLAKGFDISYYGNTIDQETWSGLLKAEHDGRAGLMHDKEWMKSNIQGAIKAIQDFSPTVVVHGILAEAAVASQILHVPNFCMGPFRYGIMNGWSLSCVVMYQMHRQRG